MQTLGQLFKDGRIPTLAEIAEHAQHQIWGDPECWAWPITDEDRDLVRRDGTPGLGDWQARRCGACGGRRRSFLVCDHDHETGLIRGFLCRSCNSHESRAPEGSRLAKWRSRPAAALFNLSEQYADYSPFGYLPEPKVDDLDKLDRHPTYTLAAYLAATPSDD